jgi:serine/threonine protein kinase
VKGTARNCDDQRLQALLDSSATGIEAEAAADHVETCPRCQSRLSELAAANDEWQEARRLLATDAEEAKLAAEARERPWSSGIESGDTPAAKPAAWTESMARQLLGPPSHPEMLGRLGRYEVERLIGSGGMGIVFKGFDTELNRPVAIKVLAPHLAGSGAARQRFSREARAAAAVVHEHVVAIHNVESDGAAPFLVMQFVAGESLQARLDRQGPLALREILRIAHQTAAGLAAAHAQGLVHRDVKPSNILLEQGIERALLTDFGLARAADDASLTHTGYLPGTPHYMSPEQARGDAIDCTSDLFSLGSVMYAMCTGRPPFRADTSFGVLRRITDTEARPIREINADIPDWLANFVELLLAKDAADRIPSAAETATLLAQCLAHVQQPDTVELPAACRVGSAHHRRRVGQAQRRPTWPQMKTSIAIAIGLTLLLFVAAVIYSTIPTSPRTPAASQPAPETDASPSDLEWDAAAQSINALSAEVDALEAHANQLWDRQPSSPPPGWPVSDPLPPAQANGETQPTWIDP